MAELAEIMRQAKRMCEHYCVGEQTCCGCPIYHGKGCGAIKCIPCNYNDNDAKDFERIVFDWAKKHPAPRYPTWREWHERMFPDAGCILNPCEFGELRRFDCDAHDCCYDCAEQPIPADIAAKLGIKPIDPDRFSCNECRYRDRPVLEEPCVQCRRSEAPGSARWAEMPDLWEVVPDDN